MFKKLSCLLLACIMCVGCVACGEGTGSGGISVSTQNSNEKDTAKKPYTNILVDDKNCTFKITGIDEDNFWGYTLKVYLENKTDKNLMFSIDKVSVNGFMIDPCWATSVAAGKKENTTISWFASDFEENGIETVTKIEFKLYVYDEDDFMSDNLIEKSYKIYPNS